jgi:DNA polymerase-1
MLSKRETDHLAVAFDNGGSQLRNEIFQNIKRTVMPPRSDKIAVPYIQALLKAMHIPIIEVKGEADDLIGTIQTS